MLLLWNDFPFWLTSLSPQFFIYLFVCLFSLQPSVSVLESNALFYDPINRDGWNWLFFSLNIQFHSEICPIKKVKCAHVVSKVYYRLIKNTVKTLLLWKNIRFFFFFCILKCSFFPVKAKQNFQQPLQETFLIIIIAENSFLLNIFVETDAFFLGLFDE